MIAETAGAQRPGGKGELDGWGLDRREARKKRTKKIMLVGVAERVGQQESKSRTQRKLGFWSQQKWEARRKQDEAWKIRKEEDEAQRSKLEERGGDLRLH